MESVGEDLFVEARTVEEPSLSSPNSVQGASLLCTPIATIFSTILGIVSVLAYTAKKARF